MPVHRKCEIRDKLFHETFEILGRIADLAQGQIDALRAGDNARLMALDKQLEQAFGEKERAFGAMKQHVDEHGC